MNTYTSTTLATYRVISPSQLLKNIIFSLTVIGMKAFIKSYGLRRCSVLLLPSTFFDHNINLNDDSYSVNSQCDGRHILHSFDRGNSTFEDTQVAAETRRPASADRTARATNFRRDL